MKEYRKTTPQGELIYKLSDTASGKMKLETVYPNGYVYETPYELDEFHLMTWGYVEVSNLGLRFNADETGELWSCLQGSVPFTENGKIGCRKGGEVVFPATADQIEFVEGGKTVFILRGRRYSLLREYGRSVISDNYDPKEGFFYKDGMEGWRKGGEVLIPAAYDKVDKWWGMEVWRLEKDGVVSYVDADMNPLFKDIPPLEGLGPCGEPFPYPTDGGKAVFVTTQFADPEDGELSIVLSDSGEKYRIDHLTRDMIRQRLLGGMKGICISEEDLRLFDDDFSYEFEAFQARTHSDRPVEDILDQFSRLGAHSNSWHYLIGIEVPMGYVLPAAQVRYLRHYFETLESRTLSLKVSIKENPSLPKGTVMALMVTHYNERCFPATFEFKWIDAFNQCTLEEILKAERSLRYQIRKHVLKQYRRQVYRDQFVTPFYNVRFCRRRSWKESKKVLDWFLQRNPEGVNIITNLAENLEYFFCNATVGSMEYNLKVIRWALSRGGDPNDIVDGKTALDKIEGTLARDWNDESDWMSKESIEHFDRKIAIIERCRDFLVAHGAKTLGQLHEEEPEVPTLPDELQRLRKFCRQ